MTSPPTEAREKVVIGGVEVPPGEKRRIQLPAGRLATGAEVSIPVEVIHGARPGPRVWLSAAIHGDELNGVEIIRQVLAEAPPRRISGVLLAAPIVNVFGFIAQSRYMPDRRDLNRSFPGSSRGSLASRLADLFMREVVRGCQVGIDLHTGSDDRTNLPQVRGDLSDPETRRLAMAFGAPLAMHSNLRDGSLRAAATREGARVLVFEGGEAGRFNRTAIDTGTKGVLQVLEALGMRNRPGGTGKGSSEVVGADGQSGNHRPRTVISSGSSWVRAGRSGLVRLDVEPGDRVEKGARIGVIKDAFGDRILRVRARTEGVVIGLTRQPHVNRGDALVHIAEVEGAG
jgi:uncharacterized protein